MDNNQDQETLKAPNGQEDEEEEALSLCDFPLNSDEPTKKDFSKNHDHRSSFSQPSDSFEFSNDLNSQNMSHAEDIISCGKLVPYNKNQSLFDDQILKSLSRDGDVDAVHLSRRYCDSLPELNSTSIRLTRSSRSLDSKKLRRNSSLVMKSGASDIRRSLSKESVRSEGFYKGPKPRWCALMFGMVKFPPAMDLQDMKNRQVRRNPGSMFSAVEGGGSVPAARSDRRSSWGHDLLRVLSCKNHASVDVAASIGSAASLRAS